jgi:hypothetical protein
MKLRDRRRLTLLLLLPLLGAVPAARADDSTPIESKNEIVVFGGYSILDATRGTERTLSPPDGGFVPSIIPPDRLPMLPPLSIQLQTGTSIGGSALFGFRYSRAIKKRLWVEADFEVGPSHHLETSRGVCIEGVRCFGTADLDRLGGRRFFPDLDFDLGGTRQVTAWNYGAGLAYELTGGDVRPLLILGAGGVSWSGAREAATDFVLRFGAGVKITFGRVGMRVEGVDYFIPDFFLNGKSEHDVHVTAGLLVRF